MSKGYEIRYGYKSAPGKRVTSPKSGKNINRISAELESEEIKEKNVKRGTQFGIRVKKIAKLILEGKNIEEINKSIKEEFGSICSVKDLEAAKKCIEQSEKKENDGENR